MRSCRWKEDDFGSREEEAGEDGRSSSTLFLYHTENCVFSRDRQLGSAVAKQWLSIP